MGVGQPKRHVAPFPSQFLFGVATADHQCEALDDAWPLDIRDVWEQNHGVPRGRATEFWTRFREDICLAKGLNCRAFRFSTSWARLQHTPLGALDPVAVEHYRDVVRAVRAAGMEPILTLQHFTWPTWLQETGGGRGLLSDCFPTLFADYAGKVAAALEGEVRYWLTFNEPNGLTFGFVKASWQEQFAAPPGRPAYGEIPDQDQQLANVETLMRNLFQAHALARGAIHRHNPVALVSANPQSQGLPDFVRRRMNRNAMGHSRTRRSSPQVSAASARPLRAWDGDLGFSLYFYLPLLLGALIHLLGSLLPGRNPSDEQLRIDPWKFLNELLFHPTWTKMILTAILSDWWQLGMAGRLPAELCPLFPAGASREEKAAITTQDFVAFDYYWGTNKLWQLAHLAESATGHFEQAPVWPGALGLLVRWHARLFPTLPILIAENGCVESASGYSRAEYLQVHLEELQRSLARPDEQSSRPPLNVIGYVCWSITTNREWGLTYRPGTDFGLYAIDLDRDSHRIRRETESARVYRKIAGDMDAIAFHRPESIAKVIRRFLSSLF